MPSQHACLAEDRCACGAWWQSSLDKPLTIPACAYVGQIKSEMIASLALAPGGVLSSTWSRLGGGQSVVAPASLLSAVGGATSLLTAAPRPLLLATADVSEMNSLMRLPPAFVPIVTAGSWCQSVTH